MDRHRRPATRNGLRKGRIPGMNNDASAITLKSQGPASKLMRVVLLLLLLAPLAAAQGHDHGTSPVRIATDLNADGLALAGHPAHFALVAFGDDEVPDFHQDLPVRVWYNDTLLWEQTVISGHDYDGINAFSIAFPGPGTWRVEALNGDDVIAERNGTVVDAGADQAELTWVRGGAYDVQTFNFDLTVDGERVNHSDTWFEIWRDGMLWFRTHTHTHDEEQEVTVRLPMGPFTARLTGYMAFPTEDGPRFAAVAEEIQGEVTDVEGALRDLGTPPTPPEAKNAAVQGTNTSPYHLVGTYDPFTQVGPDTLQHLSALVVDEHGDAVQHVDFKAELWGPDGLQFASDTLHEYDGIYDVATRQEIPGVYWLDVTASRGDWTDTIQLPYTVLPPAVATVAGPQIVTLAGSLTAGTAGDMTIWAADPAGNPFAHGEMEVQVRAAADRPALVHAKLHTHTNGDFPFRLALAEAGDHDLVVTPFPLDPQPVMGYHRGQLGAPMDFNLDVAEGPGFPATATSVGEGPVTDRAASALWVAPLAFLVLVVAAVRRRA